MIEIIPAILPKTFEELKDKLSMVSGLVPIVQIDVMDKTLTKDATWPYANGEELEFKKIINEETGFPFWEDLEFEAHLMVKSPESIVGDWIHAGVSRIIVHKESFETEEILLNFIKKIREIYGNKDSAVPLELGIALNTTTLNSEIYSVVENIDFVQFMGINTIGLQGNPFDEKVCLKIKELREKFPEIIIGVDGGVNLSNAEKLVSLGVNKLIIGSAIFNSEDILETIDDFKEIIQ